MTFVTPPRRQRGSTLLEALVALLVLSLGMFSVARVQTHLRLNADLARQRSEAVRLAQEDLERLRAFSVIAATVGARAYADIVNASTVVDASTGYASNTRYQVVRSITAADAPNAKNASVSVSWADRAGAGHQVVLNSVISGSNPAYSGALSVVPARQTLGGVNARSVRIPLGAKNLGNGSSAFKPASGGSVALIMNNTTGLVTARCVGVNAAVATQALTAADLSRCDALTGQLLSGVVRFSSAAPPSASQANEVPPAVAIALTLSGGTYPAAPSCASEAMKTVSYTSATGLRVEAVPIAAAPAAIGLNAWTETDERHVAYHCVVYPLAGSGLWSGRTTLAPAGWTIGTGPDDRRVCRYTADLDGSGAIDANAEHPASYSGVDGPLAHQNFLVIKGSEICPNGTAVKLDGASEPLYANLATTQHQP
jgi:Tfp pilus assembly protein PilV